MNQILLTLDWLEFKTVGGISVCTCLEGERSWVKDLHHWQWLMVWLDAQGLRRTMTAVGDMET